MIPIGCYTDHKREEVCPLLRESYLASPVVYTVLGIVGWLLTGGGAPVIF